MATPHNVAEKGDIAKTVLMPGDPLRAKLIAEKYLTNCQCFNTVRNMLGFTGEYQGKRISIMGSGMGMPSIGIYSYELFDYYDVDNIVRIGSCGAFREDNNLMDIILAMGASTDSNYAGQYNLPGTFSAIADYELLRITYDTALTKGIKSFVGNVVSSDVFYNDNPQYNDSWKKMGIMCVEMEACALYMNAARLGKRALCMLTVSDHLYKDLHLNAEDRQKSFSNMMEIALDAAIKY